MVKKIGITYSEVSDISPFPPTVEETVVRAVAVVSIMIEFCCNTNPKSR